MSKTRTIRLSDSEDKLVEEFLRKNSFFDFSSLTRMALMAFIQKPEINITPVKTPKKVVEHER